MGETSNHSGSPTETIEKPDLTAQVERMAHSATAEKMYSGDQARKETGEEILGLLEML